MISSDYLVARDFPRNTFARLKKSSCSAILVFFNLAMTFLRRHLQEVGICCHSLHGCHLIAPPAKVGSARKSFYLNFCLSQPPVKCVEVEASGVNVRSFGSLPDGEVLVIIQHHDQLVLLPLPAAQLKIQLVAKLAFHHGGFER